VAATSEAGNATGSTFATHQPATQDLRSDLHSPLCLIGGTGRSGTTVLKSMFARHPQVASMRTEARFLTDPDGVIDFYDAMCAGWSPNVYDMKVRRLERLLRDVGSPRGLGRLVAPRARPAGHQPRSARTATRNSWKSQLRSMVSASPAVRLRPRYWSVNLEGVCPHYDRLVEELIDRLVDFRFAGRWTSTALRQGSSIYFGSPEAGEALRWFCRQFVSCVCERQHSTHLVEDTPFNLLAFDRIHQLLPESRLVHIHRDPRDVVASYLRMTWGPSDPASAARFYVGIMQQWEQVRAKLPTGSFIEIALGALVQDPERVARQICEFWGLPYDPLVVDVDLSRSHAGRWKADIPAADQRIVENLLAPYVSRYADSTH
jgi:hypothetical protein